MCPTSVFSRVPVCTSQILAFQSSLPVTTRSPWGENATDVTGSAWDSVKRACLEFTSHSFAAFPVVFGTSHVALWHRARLRAGETLVVHGASGGVGLTAVAIGKQLGATVIATASSPDKLEVARQHGADHLVDSSHQDVRERIKELTDGRGADVVYDPVGGDLFAASLRSIAFEGRILVIGFAGGTVPQIPANHLLVKNVDVIGLNWPAYAELNPQVMTESFRILTDWYLQGAIQPHISATYPLERAVEALRFVVTRKSTGKVVITMGE